MDQAVEAVCWLFLQKRDAVQTGKATHPLPTRNLQFMIDINGGNNIRTDIDGTYNKPVTHNYHEITAPTTAKNSWYQKKRMNKKTKLYSWYTLHSECQEGRPGVCSYEDFPGRQRVFYQRVVRRAPQAHDTRYKCLEYSIDNQKNTYFCNYILKGDTKVLQCHLLHHEKYFCTNTTTTDNTDDDTDDDN